MEQEINRGQSIRIIFIKAILSIASLGMLGFIGFYVVVLSGLFPTLQELWVTSAMTTMSHQWCATYFIDSETIGDIMERTHVDDSGYSTTTSLVMTKESNNYEHYFSIFGLKSDFFSQDKEYYAQGYEKLEDGLFTKAVSGPTWKGNLMLVTDPSRVSITDTHQQFVLGETVVSMVKRAGGIAGVNAGGFADGPNYDSRGEIPSGLLIKNSEVIYPNSDDGTRYSVIGINDNNVLVLGKMTMSEAKKKNIRDAITFSPFLIVNGETVIKSGNGGWGIAPRTAIGQRQTGEIIFLVIDGRQVGHSIGVDLRVLQDVLYEEGCINAAMCDGGSSTVMVYNGKFVNKPSLGYERYINNCWLIK